MVKVNPRLIRFTVGGVNRSTEVSTAVITSTESKRPRGLGRQAERDYTLVITIAQDHASGTLWDLIWTGAGTQVAGLYAPYGNTTASASQPHYSLVAVVAEPDGDYLGGQATASITAVAVVEVEWKLTGKPTKVTA